MAKESLRDFLTYLFAEAGFTPAKQCYLNYRFALAMLAGMVVVWVMHRWVQPYPSEVMFTWVQLLSLVIWQPLFEEVLFRGIIQGELTARGVTGDVLPGVSCSNAIASSLFVLLHLVMTSSYWSFALFVPSVIYGHFRDRFDSVVPSMLLHGAYNLFVVVGLLLTGSSIA